MPEGELQVGNCRRAADIRLRMCNNAQPYAAIRNPEKQRSWWMEPSLDRLPNQAADFAELNTSSLRTSSMRKSRLYPDWRIVPGVTALAALLVPLCTLAQSPAVSSQPTLRDPRLSIALAEARRKNWKCLMRGHLRSLTESMRHLSEGEFEAAAVDTESNFG